MTTLIPKFGLKNGGSTPVGAINRAINLKLAETVSVLDFGADPTGVADSTTAFNNAIASAAGIVTIPSGTFKITSTINIDRAIELIGSGASQDVGGTPNTNTTTISYTGTGVAMATVGSGANGKFYLNISNINFVNASGGTADGGLLVGSEVSIGPSGGYVRVSNYSNLSFIGFGKVNGYGLGCGNVLNSQFNNIYTKECYYGIYLFGTNTTLTFQNCWCISSLVYGIFVGPSGALAQSTNIVFINCTNEASQGPGLAILGQVNTVDLYSYHSESNCLGGGNAPVIIQSSGSFNPIYINFYGGSIQDKVGALQFYILGSSYINWHDVVVPNYGAKFIQINAATMRCNFTYTGDEVTPSSVVNNHVDGVKVNNNAPIQFIKTLADLAATGLPFTSGILLVTDTTNNKSAIFSLNGTANTTSVMSDPDSHFANTPTALKVNIYYSSGYRIQNQTGGSIKVIAQTLMANL